MTNFVFTWCLIKFTSSTFLSRPKPFQICLTNVLILLWSEIVNTTTPSRKLTHTHIHTHIYIHTHTHTEREREREWERDTHTHTYTHIWIEVIIPGRIQSRSTSISMMIVYKHHIARAISFRIWFKGSFKFE